MKKLLFTITCAVLASQMSAQELKVSRGLPDTTYSATMNIMGVGPKNGTVTVQGVEYPIYYTGEWAARIKFEKGVNKITVKASNGDKVEYTTVYADRPVPEPITTPIIKNVKMSPASRMEVVEGDEIRIRLSSLPGAKLTWLGGEPLYEVDDKGTYQGVYVVKKDDKAFDAPIEVVIATGDETVAQPVKADVKMMESSYLVGKTTEGAYLNYGLGSDRLGGSKINYLAEGICMRIIGRVNDMYKVRLSKNINAWIPVSYMEIQPNGTFAPTSLTGSWHISSSKGYDRVMVGLDEKLPYTITEDVALSRISVRLYGAACNSNWITHKDYKAIKNVSYIQEQDDVIRIDIDLKDPQIWGYSVSYEGKSLVVNVKHRPESLKISNLTIALDAGHGKPYTGARTINGTNEDELTYDMVQRLKKILEDKGAKVVLTREGKENVDMSDRRDKAREAAADIHISIHCNAGGTPLDLKGTSTYYRHLSHKALSVAILNSLLEMDVKNFGNIGNFNFSLNQPTEYLCVLVETLFLNVVQESAQIQDPAFRQEMMERVIWGVEKFLSDVPGSDAPAPKPYKNK